MKARNPFLIESYNLHSLSTGLVSEKEKDGVNCEDAEEIGQKIQECFDNTSVYEFSLKRKDVLQPISSLLKVSSEKKSGKSIVDNTKMFIRLVAVGDRVDSLESIFDYELTTESMSLFKSGTMRKTNKSALLKCLLGDDSLVREEDAISTGQMQSTIIDGGALLHRLRWLNNMKFMEVASLYYEYICKNYRNPTIIFDGYEEATTKDIEHNRRAAIPLSTFVSIVPGNAIPYNQDRYFSHQKNKSEFIK